MGVIVDTTVTGCVSLSLISCIDSLSWTAIQDWFPALKGFAADATPSIGQKATDKGRLLPKVQDTSNNYGHRCSPMPWHWQAADSQLGLRRRFNQTIYFVMVLLDLVTYEISVFIQTFLEKQYISLQNY